MKPRLADQVVLYNGDIGMIVEMDMRPRSLLIRRRDGYQQWIEPSEIAEILPEPNKHS